MAGEDEPNWYLQDWARLKGKIQADLVKDLGWPKNQAHRVWHGRQPYRRDVLNAVARWLGVQPYEVLMPPAEAEALRRLRETAALIVAESQAPFEMDQPSKAPKPRGSSKR